MTQREREIREFNRGREQGIELVRMIFLYVLLDKFGFSHEQIQRCGQFVNSVADDIAHGRLKWQDVRNVLQDEYGYEITRSK